MSQMNNFAPGMVAGAVIGHAVGSNMRDMLQERAERREALEWKDYAQSLVEELRVMRMQVANQQKFVKNRDEAIEEVSNIARRLAADVEERQALVDKQNAEIIRLREEKSGLLEVNEDLMAEQAKRKELEAAHAKHLKFLESQNDKLLNASRANSAQAAAYDGLFQLLAAEMARSSNIEDFSNLDPTNIRKAYQQAYLGFMKTGQIVYEPDQDFAHVLSAPSARMKP